MPADSEALLALPHRFRPLGVRIAASVFGVILLVTVILMWFLFPAEVRDAFTGFQKGTVLTLGGVAFAACHALARSRVDLSDEGLTVVNGYRTYRLEWTQIVSVTLRPGSPWAILDLSDGTTRAAMGIQGSDGAKAMKQVRQLRSLLEARAPSEPEN